MADQVASLVVEVDASGAKKAAVDLDTLAKAADRADNAANDLADSSRKLSAAEQTVANEAKRAMEGVSHLAAEQEAAVKTAQRLNAAHGSAVISSKALNQATLNLGRQFADIGTSLSSGMSPLMVAVQQGPQIVDIFAQLKTQGVGAGAAFQAMGAALAPALPLILGIGAAVGVVVGAFALFERAVDKETKHATTFGDTWKAVVKVTGDYIMDGPIGDGLKWLGKAFNTTLDVITGVVAGGTVKIAGFFGASYLAIVNNWKRLPEVVGVILQNAANAAIKATEWLINKGIDGINALGKNFGFAQIGKVALGTFKSASLDIAKQFDADQKRIEANLIKGGKDFLSRVAAESDKYYEKRQKGAKAAQKATEDHTKAILANNDAYRAADDALTSYLAKLNEEIATMGMSSEQLRRRQAEQMALAADTPQLAEFVRQLAKMYEDQARVGKEAAEVQKAIGATANDNIKTFDALGIVIPTAMENAAFEMDEAASRARNLRFDIEDIARAIENHDWASGFAGLLNVLAKVEIALGKNATQLEKVQALAGIGMGVGSIVGGTAGAGISGAASGALSGAAFAGSKLGTLIAPGLGTIGGALIGGAVGLVGSLFGSSKAKKQQRAQEAAQRAAEEAQRQQTIADTSRALEISLLRAQGKELEAVAKEREAELAKLSALSPALAAQQQAVYAALDLADEQAKAAKLTADQRSLDIQLLEVMGRSEEALTMKRADLLAATDPLLRATQAQIFAEEDLAKKRAKQAEIVNAQASIQDRIDAITKTSAELLYLGREKELKAADALDASLGPMLLKLWEFEDAATKTAEATAKAAEEFERLQANQTTNIGLMRQLMAMDDAVLGTTSARDAARADELAKLDATGQYLQKIVWAREDEADRIAKQNEAMAKAAELLKQRTDLENQLLVALGMTALATERQRTAMLESLDPSLRGYQTLLYGVEDATAAVTAAESALADARSAASQAYEREASALQQTIDKFKSFAASLKSFRGSLDTGGLAMNDPMTQYARTKADFERVAGLAASGNEEALGSLQGVSEAYLEASKNAQATNVGYFKDLAAVKRATEAAQKYADQQVDQGTAQLNALNAQVSALGILNQSTLSVGQAVTNVAAAIDALARATSAKSAADAAAKQALSSAGVIPKATESLNDTSRQVMIGANDNAALAAAKVYYNSANGGIDSALFNRYFANDPFGKSVGFTGDPEELRKRYGFATGGSFTVGGSGGPDSQFVPLHLSPGEVGNITRPDVMAALLDEMRGLRQANDRLEARLAGVEANTKRGADAAQDSALVLEGAARGQLTLSTEAA